MTDTPLAAIILAAGKGTRMKSAMHKVLHPVAGRPMLGHLTDAVAALGGERSVIVAGAGREQIEAFAAPLGLSVAIQAEQLGTAHAVLQAESALAGFEGDVLILYGDVPLVSTETMGRMIARLHERDAPAVVVLGFRPPDPLAYGRIIAEHGRILKMVEHKDATTEERAETLCNSGLMAVRSADLWRLLALVGNDNAAREYYLPDIVMLANAEGRVSAVIETDPHEVAGVNSRAELAEVEALWQARRRARAMADGASLVAPETVWFAWDTMLGRDGTVRTWSSAPVYPFRTMSPSTLSAISKARGWKRGRSSAPMRVCGPVPKSALMPMSAISSRSRKRGWDRAPRPTT